MADLNDLFKVIAEGKKHYEDTTVVGQTIKQAKQNVKSDLSILFEQLTSLKEDLEKELVEEEAKLEQPMITEEIPAQPIIHTPEVRAKQVDADVDKYLTDKSFQQPNPDLVTKNIDDIRNKIKFLEQAIGRVAAAGPGGGEVNLRYLDDVDRSTITDGWYLRYSATKKKFEFAEVISSGGNGATGPAGATGVTGSSGAQGASGLNGSTGAGLDGASGVQGASGTPGIQGASGINGATGISGASGIQGASGVQGASGIQGASGSTGYQGASGATGFADRYHTTSNTTQTITNNGLLTFTTNDLGLSYSSEQHIIIVADFDNYMHASVVSYNGITGELVVDIDDKVGSGTYSSWDINLDGAIGSIGASGATGPTGATGIQGASGIGATGLTGSTGPQGNPGSGGSIANYGSFYDVTDQIASLVDTAYPIPLGQTAEAVGTSIVDGTKVKVDYQGVYNIQFSLQLHNRGGAGSGTTVEIWLRKNGTDIADSATKVDVDTNSPWSVPAWNFMLTLQANDYVQLMWSTSNTAIAIEHNTAVAPAPAIPSTILTIQQVMYTQVGATGYTGSTGVQGVQGASGATGTQGASGVNGASGTIGVNGASGATGIQGASGVGSTGAQGTSGSTGLTGATGPAVSLGPINWVQSFGASGFSGATGATGAVFTSASITGLGGPIEVTVYGDANPLVAGGWGKLQIYRDTTPIGTPINFEGSASNENNPYALHVIDNPGAGTFSYTLRLLVNAGGGVQFGETGTCTWTVKELSNVRGATGTAGINGATGPGMTYVSGYVNAGTFVTLDNIKATVTTSGNRGLALATVSGTISAFIGGYGAYNVNAFVYANTNGASPYSITTSTGNTSVFGWSFGNASDTVIYHVNDLTNSKFYRITMMIGGSYNNNVITIERLI